MAEQEEEIKLIELQPERVDYKCPDCGEPCVLWPRHMPWATQHAVPTCAGWNKVGTPKQIESGERSELTFDFLRRAKLPVLGGGTL